VIGLFTYAVEQFMLQTVFQVYYVQLYLFCFKLINQLQNFEDRCWYMQGMPIGIEL